MNIKRNAKIEFVKEMKERQILTYGNDDFLILHYLKTISKYINNSIFGSECCIWNGYITNNGVKYVNFYHNRKKTNLHRILYKNFIGELHDNNYLKYTCCNAGKCININHIEKIQSSLLQSRSNLILNKSDISRCCIFRHER